jgi:hypothetical protein
MLTWKGDVVLDKTLRAAGRAVDRVLSDCVAASKDVVPVRYSVLHGSIRMLPSVVGADRVIFGVWGSFAVSYALAVEKGTRAHIIVSKGPWSLHNKVTGQFFGRMVNHPGTRPRPFLIPVMQDKARTLPARLRQEMGS